MSICVFPIAQCCQIQCVTVYNVCVINHVKNKLVEIWAVNGCVRSQEKIAKEPSKMFSM